MNVSVVPVLPACALPRLAKLAPSGVWYCAGVIVVRVDGARDHLAFGDRRVADDDVFRREDPIDRDGHASV